MTPVPPDAAQSGDEHLPDADWLARLRRAIRPGDLGSLGAYRVVREVKRGGQGVVYEARDADGRRCALKVLLRAPWISGLDAERLRREARIVSSLGGPGFASSVHLEEVGNHLVFAMDWIDGVAANEWARQGSVTCIDDPRRVAAFGLRVSQLLHRAHQRGIIHRDIKPGNILVGADDDVTLVDFGLARRLSAPDQESSRITGLLVGTLAYLSPEQADGSSHDVDVRSDLYSLGVVLYEMATGTLPYAVDRGMARALYSIAYVEPRRPRQHNRRLDPALEAILLKLLRKDPDERYASAESLRCDLERYLRGDDIQAAPDSALRRTVRLVRSHRTLAAVSASVVVLLAGLAITLAVMYGHARDEAARATKIQAFLESTLIPPGPWTRASEYNLLDILNVAELRADRELSGQPASEASLRLRLAHVYRGLWKWHEVARHSRRSLDLFTQLEGARGPNALRARFQLGVAMTFLNDPQCVVFQRRTLELFQRGGKPDDPSVLSAHGALAYALWKGSDVVPVDEVEHHYAMALEGCGEAAALTDEECASHLYSYAAFQTNRRNVAAALRAFEQAVARYRRLSSERAVHRVNCLQDYAELLTQNGDPELAEPVFHEALSELPGSFVDLRACRTWYRLGTFALARGEGDRARTCLHRSLAGLSSHLERMRSATMQPDHTSALAAPVTAEAMTRLWSRSEAADPQVRELLLDCVIALAAVEERSDAGPQLRSLVERFKDEMAGTFTL